MPPVPEPDSVRRIVVLRANGLGDFLFATPALRALGKYFAHAEVTYLCSPWLRRFILHRYPYLPNVHAIPPYPGIRDSRIEGSLADRQRDRFFGACRAAGFELAIQMHGGGAQSNPCVRLLGAKLSAGFTA